MLINNPISIDFLIDKIGPYVELNPITGRPRLIKGINDVWLAVDEFGGIAPTAKHFAIDECFVHEWIDNHYMPAVFAFEIAKKLGYSDIVDLQQPSTGYEDAKTGYCFPWSWRLCCVEMDAVALAKRSL